MKKIKSKNHNGKYCILVDDDDYGKIIKFAPNGWEAKFTTNSNKPYVITRKTIVCEDGVKRRKQFYLHRLVMGVIEREDKVFVDHINNNPLDNRKENLRFVNSTQNMKNRTSKKTSYSKYLGVSFCKSKRGIKKYRVQIQSELVKKSIQLGYFSDEESAGYAYNVAAGIIHKEYANYNKVNINDVMNKIHIENDINNRINSIIN